MWEEKTKWAKCARNQACARMQGTMTVRESDVSRKGLQRTPDAAAAELQQELARVNAAFVNAVCDHRETKAALQQRVKTLEADLSTAKKTCKDQEYHMQQVAAGSTGSGSGSGSGSVSEEREAWAKLKGELRAENEGLRKRVRELEVVEKGWKQVRAIFTTERMPPAGGDAGAGGTQ